MMCKTYFDATQTSDPSGFANFQVSAAGAETSLLLKLNTLYMEIGKLDNELTYMNAKTSSYEATLTSTFQQEQGEEQKMDTIMQASGSIGEAAVTFGGMGADLGMSKSAQSVAGKGTDYTNFKPEGVDDVLSNAVAEDDLSDPNAKARITKLKTNFDLEKDTLNQVTKLSNGKEITDKDLLTLLSSDDPETLEAIKTQVQSKIDDYMKGVAENSERIRLISQAGGYLMQGTFSFSSATYKQAVAEAQANATILQNLNSQANTLFSNILSKADAEFSQGAQQNQILEQLIANNKNGG
ncbi:hypothetical protein [Simkania sp.]|uniref:hypothetical protein n=1 Tax=Simkania sp. TaxID=34094 RepID=UPI003B520879